ncbi:hypothetical protein [Bradyrhizobium erythrophlei]|uniref:Uncharacterized protein n=1 Tax=Bradyrhizobium erythrophlei TaxID=1437360 RepID=A0A1H4Q2Y8_9BRAD|nr:hypothetical protein [Bradyrhizobium erythrophlei]SEC13772.1 hypothetical protein SAMN05444164_1119 [Bradyrhizobium erythrophlei]
MLQHLFHPDMSTTQPENSIERGIDRRVERGWDEQADFGDENRSDVTAIRPGGAKRGSMLAYGWVALLIVASGLVNVFSSVSEFKLSGGARHCACPCCSR